MSSTAHEPAVPEGPELLLVTGHSTTTLLEQLARTARRRVPGVAEASVTLLQDGRVSSVGWTGLLAYELDEAQFVAGHGPCVDAARSGVARWVQDSRVDRRWPVYLDAAVARGALSSFSVPIPITTDDGLRAGLNLYSTVADGFSVQARETAVEVVVAAAPAVANRHVYDLVVTQVEHLHRAMETRSVPVPEPQRQGARAGSAVAGRRRGRGGAGSGGGVPLTGVSRWGARRRAPAPLPAPGPGRG